MIVGVIGSKCPGVVGPSIAIRPGYVQPAKVMDSSSSLSGSSPNPHPVQQQQRKTKKGWATANPPGIGKRQAPVETGGASSQSIRVEKATNESSEVPKSAQVSAVAKPMKGWSSGPGSAIQQSPQVTSPQTDAIGTSAAMVKTTNVGSGVTKSAPVSAAAMVKATKTGSEMTKPAPVSGGAKPGKASFGGRGSLVQKPSQSMPEVPYSSIQFGSFDLMDSSPSTSNGVRDEFPQLTKSVDPGYVSSPQRAVTPVWNKEPVGRSLESAQVSESKDSASAVQGTSAIDPNSKSGMVIPKGESERPWGGPERVPSGSGEWSSRDSVSSIPPPAIIDEDFPPLGSSLAVAGKRKNLRKGGGRGPAEHAQAQAPLPIEHQEPPKQTDFPPLAGSSVGNRRPPTKWGGRDVADQTQASVSSENQEPKRRDGANSPTSSQAGQDRERQSNLVQSRKDANHGERKLGDRQGAELGNGLETGGRRYYRQDYQGNGPAAEKEKAIDALGRTLTRILRHQAVELKLKMSNDGYVDVRDLLKLPMKTGANRPLHSHSIDDVYQVADEDKKQRFGMKEEGGRVFIRANQGHTIKSLKSEELLQPIVSPEEIPVCVHGTYFRHLDQIFKEGLKRMGRNHVHFATGLVGSEGLISGMRKTCEALIYLNVETALADGMKLYISENKVILTEGFEGVVPPKYFKEVLRLPDMKPITPRS